MGGIQNTIENHILKNKVLYMATITMPSGVSTYVQDAYHYEGEKVLFDDVEMYDVNYCGDAALYYLNSRGSFDAFLIEGGIKRIDKFTQQDYYKSYDNRTIEFGRNRFVTELKPTWELYTGWLTDEEAERLCRNLLPSTQVYLHTLDDYVIRPVVIVDSQAEYKTYENQNYQLVSYTIKVEASQTDYRN